NNGDGTFTDISVDAKVAQPVMQGMSIAPTDFDNRRDIDLLLVARDRAPVLYRNMRDGTFQDVAQETGLAPLGVAGAGATSGNTCAAAGDVNKDGFTDFYLCRSQGPGVLMLSDGHEHFRAAENGPAISGAFAAQFLDYDNDGLLDLVAASPAGLHVWRNLGRSWVDVSGTAVKAFNATLSASSDRRVASFSAGAVRGCAA